MFAPGEYAKTKALVKNMAMRLMKVTWLEGAGEVWGSESCRDFDALMCLASHALAVQPSIPKHDVLEDCSEMLTNVHSWEARAYRSYCLAENTAFSVKRNSETLRKLDFNILSVSFTLEARRCGESDKLRGQA